MNEVEYEFDFFKFQRKTTRRKKLNKKIDNIIVSIIAIGVIYSAFGVGYSLLNKCPTISYSCENKNSKTYNPSPK